MERYSPLAGGPDMLLPEPDADTAAAGQGTENSVRGEKKTEARMAASTSGRVTERIDLYKFSTYRLVLLQG